MSHDCAWIDTEVDRLREERDFFVTRARTAEARVAALEGWLERHAHRVGDDCGDLACSQPECLLIREIVALLRRGPA